MRVTIRGGRVNASIRHNDRTFDIVKASHINEAKTSENVYWAAIAGQKTFEDVELSYYETSFREWIDGINARAEKSRHYERRRSPRQIWETAKFKPEEQLFQIGDRKESVPAALLLSAFRAYLDWQDANFGEHIKVLDWALHVDETTPHIHMRQVWTYTDPKDGVTKIGQDKALEAMGFKLPFPNKPKTKDNNRKKEFSAMCRKQWINICERYGVAVDRDPDPKYKRKRLETDEYKIQQDEARIAELSRLTASYDDFMRKAEIIIQEAEATAQNEIYGAQEAAQDIEDEAKQQAEAIIRQAKDTANNVMRQAKELREEAGAAQEELEQIKEFLDDVYEDWWRDYDEWLNPPSRSRGRDWVR